MLRTPDKELRRQYVHAPLTARGAVRKPGIAVKTDRVTDLLRHYSRANGCHRPNPKHKSLARFHTYLPHKELRELADALVAWEMERTKSAKPVPVHMSRLKAARYALRKHEQHWITLGSKVSLMRCATCDMLDNMVKPSFISEYRRTGQEIAQDRLQKDLHVATALRQRAFFDSLKAKAMAEPETLWCITLDGMDQSKTQLPHYPRYNKITDGLERLKVHAEGGFCFGGPVPIMGLLNFSDLRKDSSLCVLTVERMLDIQWSQFMTLAEERQRVRDAKAQARAAAAIHDPAIAQEIRDEAAAAPSVHTGEMGT